MLTAPNIRAPHGFSTRSGGVSVGMYAMPGSPKGSGGLNMDEREVGGLQDQQEAVQENRRRLIAALGGNWQLSLLDQVHGLEVITVTATSARQHAPLPRADAQVCRERGVLLGIMTADCFPVLLHDPVAGVVGAAHAGWRGAAGRIAAKTVEAMQQLGAHPEDIQAAIGVGICAAQYPVGQAVIEALQQAGLGQALKGNHADLAAANTAALEQAGVPAGHIWQAGRCSTEPEFYSYRRDTGRTGRMLAVIGLRE